jgi:glutathione peroxidase
MHIYDFNVTTIDGQTQNLGVYRGRVLVIVNVASECAFTPQYVGLESLYQRHRSQGLTILGFPCDQFLHQEPGNEAEIKNFCSRNYQVTFPLFAKVEVNGDHAHPLFKYLKSARRGWLGSTSIKWNFTKFLVDRDGTVIRRFSPLVVPARMEKFILPLLGDSSVVRQPVPDTR